MESEENSLVTIASKMMTLDDEPSCTFLPLSSSLQKFMKIENIRRTFSLTDNETEKKTSSHNSAKLTRH